MIGYILVFVVPVAAAIAYFIYDRKKQLRIEMEYLERFKRLRSVLESVPTCEETMEEMVEISRLCPVLSQKIYKTALAAVEKSGGSSRAKQFALTMGRAAYSYDRADKKPTVYDEQAIQNDIRVRETPGSV